jgi:hypothetical protein
MIKLIKEDSSQELRRVVSIAGSKCMDAGISDEESDLLLDKVIHVYNILGYEPALAVAKRISNINPDYTFSNNPKTLKKQIADWLY